MLRLLGGVLIVSGGILLRETILRAARKELQTQRELRDALLQLEKEIKFTLTPLPKLLLRDDFEPYAAQYFRKVGRDLLRGETLAESWAAHAQTLSLPQRIRDRFARLGVSLSGEEESVRRTLLLMVSELSESIEAQERIRRERERLTTVLCISISLMLVLLLI